MSIFKKKQPSDASQQNWIFHDSCCTFVYVNKCELLWGWGSEVTYTSSHLIKKSLWICSSVWFPYKYISTDTPCRLFLTVTERCFLDHINTRLVQSSRPYLIVEFTFPCILNHAALIQQSQTVSNVFISVNQPLLITGIGDSRN